MNERFYICRIWLDPKIKATRFTYLSKGYGWCKRFEDAVAFSDREAALIQLSTRQASIWPESELKASPYYQAEIESEMKKTVPKTPQAATVPGTKIPKSGNLAIQKKAPKWHKQIAAELTKEFRETNELSEKARHRRLRLGFMFIFTKEMGKEDESIPHGQFGPWLEEYCPAIPRSTSSDYISEAKSVCDLVGWQVEDIIKIRPHNLLGSASESDRKKHEKFFAVINQKGSIRAITEYKQAGVEDDATVAKVGRLSGHGGASKEHRANAADRERQEIVNERKTKAVEIAEWLTEMSDDKGLGEIFGTPELIQLDLAMETARGYIRHGAPENTQKETEATPQIIS